jgi:hypothetical protein
MTWKGKKMNVGWKYSLRYPINPRFVMPYRGTAIKTHMASAAVVVREEVGATYPGTITRRLDNPINRKRVPFFS